MKKKLSKLSKLYTEADFQLTVLSRNDIGLQEFQSLFIISFLGDVSCKNIRCNLVHADLPKDAVKNFYRCFEWSTQRCWLACRRITKIFSVQLRLRRPICLWPCRSRMSRSLQVEFKFAELTSAVLGLLILPKQDCPLSNSVNYILKLVMQLLSHTFCMSYRNFKHIFPKIFIT